MPATIPPSKIAITFHFEHKRIDLPATYGELLRAAYDNFHIDQAMRLAVWLVEIDGAGRNCHLDGEGLFYILEAGDRDIFNMINEPVPGVEVCYYNDHSQFYLLANLVHRTRLMSRPMRRLRMR